MVALIKGQQDFVSRCTKAVFVFSDEFKPGQSPTWNPRLSGAVDKVELKQPEPDGLDVVHAREDLDAVHWKK